MDLSSVFANEIMALGPQDVSNRDLLQLQRLMLDHIAVALSGSRQPWMRALHDWALTQSGRGMARLIGAERDITVPADVAALINGTAAHSRELDDTHEATLSHPGCVVIAAAMAVAPAGTSGRQLLSAVTAGYEALTRIGQAANPQKVLHAGFHPTALFGGFGAATAAAKLMGLDARGLQMAWGHVLSLSGGAMQFSDESSATDVKRLHAGYAARNGVMAAQFAARGVSAPLRSLDGKYGFLALYGNEKSQWDVLGRIGKQISSEPAIHQVSIKPYSCCRFFHCIIDCLVALQEQGPLKRDDVSGIVVRSFAAIGEQHMLRRPASSMAAQYSLPYSVGATLAYGATGYEAYEPDLLQDGDIDKWSALVSFQLDEHFEQRYPEHYGAGVDIRFKDGSVRSMEVGDGTGSPENPITGKMFDDKVRRLIHERHPQFVQFAQFDIKQLTHLIDSLPGADDAGELIHFITRALP